MRTRFSALGFILTLCGVNAVWAQVIEDFKTPVTTANGQKLGKCQQLTAALAGSGSLAVQGDGAAVLSTPTAADAALLASSQALPAAGYTVSVTVTGISYPFRDAENGVTLLAIADTAPQPDTEDWWSAHRLIAIEVDATADTQGNNLFLNYWGNGGMYTWSGGQWASGGDSWKPALSYESTQTYQLEIAKTSAQYTVRVLAGSAELAKATLPASELRAASQEWLVIGDRLTSAFSGGMRILSVSSPGTSVCANSSGTSGTSPNGGAPASEEYLDPAQAGADGGSGPIATRLNNANGNYTFAGNPTSACDCQIGAPTSLHESGAWVWVILALLALRRQRA